MVNFEREQRDRKARPRSSRQEGRKSQKSAFSIVALLSSTQFRAARAEVTKISLAYEGRREMVNSLKANLWKNGGDENHAPPGHKNLCRSLWNPSADQADSRVGQISLIRSDRAFLEKDIRRKRFL